MTLANGQSELDTVTLRLPDYGKEIKNWSSYHLNRAFLVPTAAWTFTISDEDLTLTHELLTPGARVELAIGGNVQCSGVIDKKTVEASTEGGTHVAIHGRDILGRVVDATMDPAFKFTSGLTVIEFLLTVLAPFGIDVVYNYDGQNVRVLSGFDVGKGGSSVQKVNAKVVSQIVTNADGTATEVFVTEARTLVVSSDPTRADLTKLTLQQAKPHAGEGCFAYIDRMLKRLGLAIWAAADGSGVIVDSPNYTQQPRYTITQSTSAPERNNVTHVHYETDLSTQPSVIVAFGFGGGQDVEKSRLKCCMINELLGLDDNGGILPSVKLILARYKGAQVLPLRPKLSGFRKPLGDKGTAVPLFLKDDESKTPEQLAAFVRREMARRQMRGLQLTYDFDGHSQDGHPWAVNTQVAVNDEALGVNETMWVQEVSFAKAMNGGTTGQVKLIRPYTLMLGP